MSEFQRLFEEDRSSRRTIADAIEVLRQACDFNSNDRAEIRIGPLRLSPRDVVGLVDVGFKAPIRDKKERPNQPRGNSITVALKLAAADIWASATCRRKRLIRLLTM
jgi:hypothetical protein